MWILSGACECTAVPHISRRFGRMKRMSRYGYAIHNIGLILRISNKYWSVTATMTQPNNYVLEGEASNQVSAMNRRQFHTPILLLNWILTNQQTWMKPRKRCVSWMYVMLFQSSVFIRNLFRVRLPYLLLIRRFDIN
jgi:hypothetical protein